MSFSCSKQAAILLLEFVDAVDGDPVLGDQLDLCTSASDLGAITLSDADAGGHAAGGSVSIVDSGSPAPAPATILLTGTGITALAWRRRKRAHRRRHRHAF